MINELFHRQEVIFMFLIILKLVTDKTELFVWVWKEPSELGIQTILLDYNKH